MKSSLSLLIALVGGLSLAGCVDVLDPATDDAPDVETAKAAPAEPPINKVAPHQRIDPTGDVEPAVDSAPQQADKSVDVVDEPEPNIDADIYVKRLVISEGVGGREPVGAASSFTEGSHERIYAFVEVGNRDQVASEIHVSFYKEGSPERAGVRLKVGAASRWRTWSYTRRAKTPGSWHAVVRNGKGEELARKSFEIKAKGGDVATSEPPVS